MEIWITLKDAANYSISNEGRLRNNTANCILMQYIDAYGYPFISYINNDNKRRYKTIHRLVAENFMPNYDAKLQVNHKDGIKLNSNLTNLEWVTAKANIIHALETGLNGNTTPLIVTDLRNGEKYNYRSIKDLGKNIGIAVKTLIPYIKRSKDFPILDRYVIEITDESLLNSRSNTKVFGSKLYVFDEIENKLYDYPSINLVLYNTGIRSLHQFVNKKDAKASVIGYQISNRLELIDIRKPDNIEELEVERKKYLSIPYNPRNEYYLLYDYFSKEEIRLNSIKEIMKFINERSEYKVCRKIVANANKSVTKYNKTGLIRGFGIKIGDVDIKWYPYKEEIIVCSQLALTARVAVYKVWKDTEYKLCLGHKALCEFIDYRYDRSWYYFNLRKESRFFNIPNLRIERLNKPFLTN